MSFCGKIINLSESSICSTCVRKEGDLIRKSKDFLRMNPGADVERIANHVGCSKEQIEFFIASGKMIGTAVKFTHECRLCQKPTTEPRLCLDCQKALKNQITPIASESTDSSDDKIEDDSQSKSRISVGKLKYKKR